MTNAPEGLLRRLPKVELHCHVEGAARASTILELAAFHGIDLPSTDPAELFAFTDLNQFLSIYEVICASLRTADDFHRKYDRQKKPCDLISREQPNSRIIVDSFVKTGAAQR